MNTIRTFIAVDVGDAVRRRAADLVERLRVGGGDVKWVDPHNMHLTLKFLGDVPDPQTADICRAVAEAAGKSPMFEIGLRGAGAFPHAGRPRTVWMGVDRGADLLASLHTAIEKALAKLGFRKEARRFHPHLTLGRVRRGGSAQRDLGRLINDNGQFDGGVANINEVLVFASFLDKEGPTYNVLGRARLGR
ncbi:MAG: RNA 2',3'-cyclic phosphodiesterase [Planctomycetes bacterium]|nr:RNA 2',3'-cyclic phosphodiesterase [Planctomycetota bacterium]MBL7042283.1 RNA 2',3'-cyclic phosphodiesterase [Pirellulaceae bacterium]